MLKTYQKLTPFIFLFLLPTLCNAGAGAKVQACIYLPVQPISTLKVKFTSGGSGSRCMYDTGKNAELDVNHAGVTCTSVGYVESKASSSGGDFCATADSIWPLGYKIDDTAYTGSTDSKWSHPIFSNNSISLQNQSPGTVVCTNPDLCVSTAQKWEGGTQGPLYIIFQPMYTGGASLQKSKVSKQNLIKK